MKSLEIKKLAPGSVFKSLIYLMILPCAIFILIGIIFLLFSLATSNRMLLFPAIMLIIIYPIIMLFVYTGIGALQALIYNACAQKFGGLEVSVKEAEALQVEESLNLNQ